MVAFIIGDDSDVSRVFFLGGGEALFPWGALQRGKKRREKDSFFPYRLEKSPPPPSLGGLSSQKKEAAGCDKDNGGENRELILDSTFSYLHRIHTVIQARIFPLISFSCPFGQVIECGRQTEGEEPFFDPLVPLNESALVCLGKGGRGNTEIYWTRSDLQTDGFHYTFFLKIFLKIILGTHSNVLFQEK